MSEPTVMEFFKGLSTSQQDIFVSVATDLQTSAPPDKIKRLSDFHSKLKNEIDQINRRRQSLGGVLNNINTLLKFLEDYIRNNGESLDTIMFRNNLQKVSADLKAEIASLKPEKKLVKKFDVARRKESLVQRSDLAGHLFTDILGSDEVKESLSPGINKNEQIVQDDTEEIMEDITED